MKNLYSLFIFNVFIFLVAQSSVFASESNPQINSSQAISQGQTNNFELSSKTINDVFPGNNIELTTFNNLTLLTGQVATRKIRTDVFREVKNYAKTTSVLNYLTVGKNLTLSQNSQDVFITSKVIANILTITGLIIKDVKIVTSSKTVYILGRVTRNQRAAIIKNVELIGGVHKVIDLLTIID